MEAGLLCAVQSIFGADTNKNLMPQRSQVKTSSDLQSAEQTNTAGNPVSNKMLMLLSVPNDEQETLEALSIFQS